MVGKRAECFSKELKMEIAQVIFQERAGQSLHFREIVFFLRVTGNLDPDGLRELVTSFVPGEFGEALICEILGGEDIYGGKLYKRLIGAE
jgi:hypothetical protein